VTKERSRASRHVFYIIGNVMFDHTFPKHLVG